LITLLAEYDGHSTSLRAGIQFIDDDEFGGFGLRMAKKKRKR